MNLRSGLLLALLLGVSGPAFGQAVQYGGPLGTPSSGNATNLTNINGAAITGSIPSASLPLATTGAFGAVKPDGTTITISGGVISSVGGGGGGVSTVSVATGNGFAGTVANPTTTPAITLTTTVTGLLKGNGTAISAATAGTDYLTPTGNGSGLTGLTNSQVSGSAPLTGGTLTSTSVNGVTLSSTGSSSLFLNQAGAYVSVSSGGLNPISNTLTTSGAVTPADTLTIITGGTAFTLASAADTHTHKINNQSTANVTVTFSLNGVSQGIVIAPGSVLGISYQSTLSTYIIVS